MPEIEDEDDDEDEDDEEEEAVAIDAQLTVINACLFASVVSQVLCVVFFVRLCTHSSPCVFVQLWFACTCLSTHHLAEMMCNVLARGDDYAFFLAGHVHLWGQVF